MKVLNDFANNIKQMWNEIRLSQTIYMLCRAFQKRVWKGGHSTLVPTISER